MRTEMHQEDGFVYAAETYKHAEHDGKGAQGACLQPNHPVHQVLARDILRDAMLHLQPSVHLRRPPWRGRLLIIPTLTSLAHKTCQDHGHSASITESMPQLHASAAHLVVAMQGKREITLVRSTVRPLPDEVGSKIYVSKDTEGRQSAALCHKCSQCPMRA